MVMSSKLSNDIKAEALRLGFFRCGIAKAEAVDEKTTRMFRQWLDEGGNAGMEYMNNHIDKRLDPRLLMDGLQSIVCVVLNYAPATKIPVGEYQLSAYAYGYDYHDVVKSKLHQLASNLHITNYKAFCDSAPVLERYWAEKAGLGWTGRNHQLIIPQAGSMFFLGELFLDIPLEADQPMQNRCGTCEKCVMSCPTGALASSKGDSIFDANHCLSYLTIENRGPIPDEAARKMDTNIYGCDRCQEVCPWNRFASPNNIPELQIKGELLEMTKTKWDHLTEDDFKRIFKNSAVKRAKYAGLMRNIHAVEENDKQQKS
jgi:epoxyqueuosine reductase